MCVCVKQIEHCLLKFKSEDNHLYSFFLSISECAKGVYGEGCTSVCSNRNCYNDDICDFQTGRCVDGCQAGWEGTTCTSGDYYNNTNLLLNICENKMYTIY